MRQFKDSNLAPFEIKVVLWLEYALLEIYTLIRLVVITLLLSFGPLFSNWGNECRQVLSNCNGESSLEEISNQEVLG